MELKVSGSCQALRGSISISSDSRCPFNRLSDRISVEIGEVASSRDSSGLGVDLERVRESKGSLQDTPQNPQSYEHQTSKP